MQRAKTIRVVGQDPSLRNWGLAIGTYCIDTGEILIEKLDVICAEVPKGKQVRQNSSDIECSVQLYKGAAAACLGSSATFIEVPVGSQSSRACVSYGACVGVLGAMRATGIPFFEVTATEVKMAGAGKAHATKKQMIDWAVALHPEANWPTHRKGGKDLVTESSAEHMADAVAAIHAGIKSNSFQQLLSLLTANHS
jgi:Holliday junction resolvasome RuvABC endonuclease subunit